MTPTATENKPTALTVSSIIALLAGLWLFISPWVYGAYQASNAWNSWIVGAIIAIVAAFRLGYPADTQFLSWINTLLGIWTFISPWIYSYTDHQGRFINSLCVGVIVFLVAIRNAMSTPHMHHPVPGRT